EDLDPVLDFPILDVRPLEHVASRARDRDGQPRQILQYVKLPLVLEPETRPVAERGRRQLLDYFDADAAARLELPADDVRRFAARREEVSGEPLEVAVDLVPPHDRFDLVDRRRMALPRQAGVLRAVQLLDPEEPVVDRAREMGRRPAGLAAPDDA